MNVEHLSPDKAGGFDAVEARNSLRAEYFRKLPETIPLWRFRDVLVKLGTELGLSGGAVVYAIDLMGFLTEADWRGDGQAVTYHSLRTYARKVGKSERTIGSYERQLVVAGLVHRTVKHARRHGGMGVNARRTGLDWRSFGVRLPELLDLLEKRQAEEQIRLDLETQIRSTRRVVAGLIESAGNTANEDTAKTIRRDYAQIGLTRLRKTLEIRDLRQLLGSLAVLKERIASILETRANHVDNGEVYSQTTDQSEDSDGLIDTTDISTYPSDTCSSVPNKNLTNKKWPVKHRDKCIRYENESSRRERTRSKSQHEALPPLETIWNAAPETWKTALGSDERISWPILIDIAQHLAPALGVSPHAWHKALNILGPSEAALALIILDRNRSHPTRPVQNVGGALVGMVRRAEEGAFNLAPSIYGILARTGTHFDRPSSGRGGNS